MKKKFLKKNFFFEILKFDKILKFFKNRGKQTKYDFDNLNSKTSDNLQKI